MGERKRNSRRNEKEFFFLFFFWPGVCSKERKRDSKTPNRYMHEPPSELTEEQERDVLVRSIEV